MEYVVLVDEADRQLGKMEKMQAHREGVLHRAFSVFLFNHSDEMLLQRRALKKYHGGGLWTNACCGHPRPDEPIADAVRRRVREELGIDVQLDFAFPFIYRANVEYGLIEHEYDHVFAGSFNGRPIVDMNEVAEWKFLPHHAIVEGVRKTPGQYTEWFKVILQHPQFSKLITSAA